MDMCGYLQEPGVLRVTASPTKGLGRNSPKSGGTPEDGSTPSVPAPYSLRFRLRTASTCPTTAVARIKQFVTTNTVDPTKAL